MIALLLGTALAATGPWSDPSSGARIDFPEGWTWQTGGALLDGQLLQATHTATGGGLLVRVEAFDAASLPERVQARVGDVDAGLSADRYARALALSQEDGSSERTLYLGLSDVAGARVGRWVFHEPASASEPARIWWHAVWRTGDHFAQVVAWVPADRFSAFLPAMRDLEPRLSGDHVPPAALLYRSNGRCEGPASVDRMAAIAASEPFTRAREALGADGWDVERRALAELQALGVFVTTVDACVLRSAPTVNACVVYERASGTERSRALQQAVVRCLETDRDLARSVERLR